MMSAAHDQDSDPSDPAAVDHLEDLRAQLPAEFRNASDDEAARLWVAWESARHGHAADYLTDTCGISAATAERLETLAQHERDQP